MFDPDKGYYFSTYAGVAIRNVIKVELQRNAKKIQPLSLDAEMPCQDQKEHTCNLNETLTDIDEKSVNQEMVETQMLEDIYRWVKKRCTANEALVYEYLMGIGREPLDDCAKIARELNLSHQRVYELRRTLRAKIQQKFSEDLNLEKI